MGLRSLATKPKKAVPLTVLSIAKMPCDTARFEVCAAWTMIMNQPIVCEQWTPLLIQSRKSLHQRILQNRADQHARIGRAARNADAYFIFDVRKYAGGEGRIGVCRYDATPGRARPRRYYSRSMRTSFAKKLYSGITCNLQKLLLSDPGNRTFHD